MYFSIDLNTISAGLIHQQLNLVTLIKYCYKNNYKLIRPTFILTGIHNNNKEIRCDLSNYYDLDNIFVNNVKYHLYKNQEKIDCFINKKEYKNGLLCNDNMFIDSPQINVTIKFLDKITQLASKIAKLLDTYLCIHVRRGDRVINDQIDLDTQPENIINIIKKCNIKNVYIMTNDIDSLRSLKENKDYNIFFYTDFDYLNQMKDNYYLFSVENEIMRFANKRCSTFNTIKLNYYHYHLTDTIGLQ
jgi:hypothetical protein